jgi:hypothetical protein
LKIGVLSVSAKTLPGNALVAWTLIVEVWMYATRLPAMRTAKVDVGRLKRAQELEVLPIRVQQVADNYNHLHEQPVCFYALAIYGHLAGVTGTAAIALAWTYVGLRIAHSLIQCTFNFVPLRFFVFVTSSLVLAAMVGLDVAARTAP